MRWSHLREFLSRQADCKTCLRCARVAALIAILELIWDVMKSGIDLCAGWLYTTTPLQVSAKLLLPRSANLKHYFWVTFHWQAYFETQFRSIPSRIYQKDFPIWHRVQQNWNSWWSVGSHQGLALNFNWFDNNTTEEVDMFSQNYFRFRLWAKHLGY